MPQYLVANYLPDDFDPSAVTEAMIEEIHALNREMIAAGVRKFAAAFPRLAARRRCGPSPTARCSSPTGRTPRPRSTWAVSGYLKPLIWTRRWRGRARVPSPAVRRARCASFCSSRTRREQRNSLAAATSEYPPSSPMGRTSQREATPLAPTRTEEEKNSEIPLFWSRGRHLIALKAGGLPTPSL